MAEISIWSATIIVMLMMFAASIGFVAAGILAGARSLNEDANRLNSSVPKEIQTKNLGAFKPPFFLTSLEETAPH